MQRIRFVMQQHDRANAARITLAETKAILDAGEQFKRTTRYLEKQYLAADAAFQAAEKGEDAAIAEFADFVFDFIEKYPARSPTTKTKKGNA